MSQGNLDLLKELTAAFEGGDFDKVLAGFTDDATVHIGGSSRIAGDYHGHQGFGAVMGQYVAALGEIQEMETHDLLASDDHGVFLQTVTAKKGDRTMTIHTVNVFHFTGGKVSEMWSSDFEGAEADAFYDM